MLFRSGVLELAKGVLIEQIGDEQVSAVDRLVGVDLGGRWQPLPRFGLGVTLPVWLNTSGEDPATGPALGDAYLWAPIAVVLPHHGTDDGFALQVLPSLGLPTGNANRLLGDRSFRPGLALVPGFGAGPVSLSVNAGVTAGANSAISTQAIGGPSLSIGGALGVDVESGFEPYYVVDPEKKKIVTALRKHLTDADELLLATDEDREGEDRKSTRLNSSHRT